MLRLLASVARHLADRIAPPSADEPDCSCLSCRFREAVLEHAEATAGPSGAAIDAMAVVSAAATIVGEIAVRAGDDEVGDMIVETAHATLDAALINLRTGVPQPVFLGGRAPRSVH